MRLAPVAALAAAVAGAVLIGDSVARGGAQLTLVLIVPIVAGHSVEFLGGVALLVGGVLATPLSLSRDPAPEPPPSPGPTSASTGSRGAGGLVLLGPVPVFFGNWRGVSRRTRWAVAAAGVALTGAVVLAWWIAR